MSHIRGIVMLAAAGIAFYCGWRAHGAHDAMAAFGLGALALGVSLWHLTRSKRNGRAPG
jgi:hypothetical protein